MFSTTARMFALCTVVLSFAITGCSNTRCYLANRSCCDPCSCGPRVAACGGQRGHHGGLHRYRGPCNFAAAYRALWQNYCFERNCPPIDELVGPPCVTCGTGPDSATKADAKPDEVDETGLPSDADVEDDLQDVSLAPADHDDVEWPEPPPAEPAIREANPTSDIDAESPEAPLPPNIIPTQGSNTKTYRNSLSPKDRSGRLLPHRFLVAAKRIVNSKKRSMFEGMTIDLSPKR